MTNENEPELVVSHRQVWNSDREAVCLWTLQFGVPMGRGVWGITLPTFKKD